MSLKKTISKYNLQNYFKNSLTIFSSNVEILLLNLLCGRLPQKVIDPVLKTFPPLLFSKYSISALSNLSKGSPGTVVKCVRCSSGTKT